MKRNIFKVLGILLIIFIVVFFFWKVGNSKTLYKPNLTAQIDTYYRDARATEQARELNIEISKRTLEAQDTALAVLATQDNMTLVANISSNSTATAVFENNATITANYLETSIAITRTVEAVEVNIKISELQESKNRAYMYQVLFFIFVVVLLIIFCAFIWFCVQSLQRYFRIKTAKQTLPNGQVLFVEIAKDGGYITLKEELLTQAGGFYGNIPPVLLDNPALQALATSAMQARLLGGIADKSAAEAVSSRISEIAGRAPFPSIVGDNSIVPNENDTGSTGLTGLSGETSTESGGFEQENKRMQEWGRGFYDFEGKWGINRNEVQELCSVIIENGLSRSFMTSYVFKREGEHDKKITATNYGNIIQLLTRLEVIEKTSNGAYILRKNVTFKKLRNALLGARE